MKSFTFMIMKEFKKLESVEITGKGTIYAVSGEDMGHPNKRLEDKLILLDGELMQVVDQEYFPTMPPLYVKDGFRSLLLKKI